MNLIITSLSEFVVNRLLRRIGETSLDCSPESSKLTTDQLLALSPVCWECGDSELLALDISDEGSVRYLPKHIKAENKALQEDVLWYT